MKILSIKIYGSLLGLFLGMFLWPSSGAAQFVSSIEIRQTDDASILTESELTGDNADYFNLARCLCDTSLTVKLNISASTASIGSFWIFSGTSCFDSTNSRPYSDTCQELVPQTKISNFAGYIKYEFKVNASRLMTKNGGSCSDDTDATNYQIWVFTDSDDEKWVDTGVYKKFRVDMSLPDKPIADSEALGCGEGVVTMSFSGPAGSTTTTTNDAGTTTTINDPYHKGYQILCQKWNSETGTGSSAGLNETPILKSTYDICEKANSSSDSGAQTMNSDASESIDSGVADISLIDADLIDAGTTDSLNKDGTLSDSNQVVTGQNNLLRTEYVCSGTIASPGKVTVSGLTTGQEYKFWVVKVDTAGNPSEPVELGVKAPCPETPFWEKYQNMGGKATGCNIGIDSQNEITLWLLGGSLLLLVGMILLRNNKRRIATKQLIKGEKK